LSNIKITNNKIVLIKPKEMKKLLIAIVTISVLTSCVGKKKFTDLQANYDGLQTDYNRTQKECEDEITSLSAQLKAQADKIKQLETSLNTAQTDLSAATKARNDLQKELEYFKSTNTTLLARLSDLSIVSKSGAETIQKSLEALNEQNKYIKDLTGTIQQKDSMNLSLVMNLKRSLANINDEDVSVEVREGVVYVSISDKLLFRSGSSIISARASEVLGKVAKVINDHNNVNILVEGHTDNLPISNECVTDNWDLSVNRATSVVRALQKKHGVDPSRLTAGGRAEFAPKTSNDNSAGRKLNRRTEIIITPKLDEFFQLMQP
jgi:chemotaxis protein MotB